MLEDITERLMDTSDLEDGPGDELIEFFCYGEDQEHIPEPKPSVKELPTWYKMLPSNTGPGRQDVTVRRCPAFLDALSSGWMLRAPSDITVCVDDGAVSWECDMHKEIVTEADFGNREPDFGVGSFAVNTRWGVTVPDGYSVLLTQPFNRLESRFHVISQLIDADSYTTFISCPMVWMEGDGCSTIHEGEPLLQVLPFDRESRISKARALPFEENEEIRKEHRNARNQTSVEKSYYKNKEWEGKATRMVDEA